MNYTPEQIMKARAAKSAEELFSLAKAGGVPMTEDEAKKYFAALHAEGELSETELCTAAGGKNEEPQKYTVYAAWKPSCDGRYVGTTDGCSPNLPAGCCGTCGHYRGDRIPDACGFCMREF